MTLPVLQLAGATLPASASILDGMSVGIALMVVLFALAMGLVYRSSLLLVHAAAVTSYTLFTCVRNGYLAYLPDLVPWTEELAALTSIASTTSVLTYFYILYQAAKLPRAASVAFALVALLFCTGRILSITTEPEIGQWIARAALSSMSILVLGAFLTGLWLGVRQNWLAWSVVSLLTLQAIVRYVLKLEQLPWQSPDTYYQLSSNLPGVILLACTLILAIQTNRRREHQVQQDLDKQRETEHERLEGMVELRTEQLREALQDRNSLLARISHDLRTPLVGIIDYARLLQNHPETTLTYKIERSARQQLEMIDELLEFSRDGMKGVELSPVPGYLYGFLHEMEEEGRILAQRHGNRFECSLTGTPPPIVRADFRRLRQILINLLGNAAKFTQDGTVHFAVELLSLDSDNARCKFSVIDSGIGINPDEQEQLLQPYQRGSNATAYAGTGLGLSIVKQLLDCMDSELTLRNRASGGSHFSFELALPLADEDELDAITQESHTPISEGNGQILIVDDSQLCREWLTDLLGGYGYEISTAADSHEALVLLEHQPSDLVICDQRLPDLNGWYLLREIRHRYSIPVILHSAMPPNPPQDWTGPGFDRMLLKPISNEELLKCIETLLQFHEERMG